MALSDEPLDSENVKDYEKVCKLTKEGMFVNIVDKGKKADTVAGNFFNTMEVYPSTSYPIVSEFFQRL